MMIDHLQVYLVNASAALDEHRDESEQALAPQKSNCTVYANFEIEFDGSMPFMEAKRVHEDITIATPIRSKLRFPKGRTYNNLNQAQRKFNHGLV